MRIEELEKKFQAALEKRFPGVIVRENRRIPEPDILPYLDAFMIPDERRMEAFHFQIDEWNDFIAKENLPDCDVYFRTVSDTEKYHPHVFKLAQQKSMTDSTPAKTPVRVAESRGKKKKAKLKPALVRKTTRVPSSR